ncbi:cell division protease FtsH [Keratinibaculum paraultunense]|uniref:ATP-dependent zinc metalloprotease FtsH n=1 Tax=Keratinibaculum paraultunense TaxID=1278232 RepID=A0A4R3KSJ6_9FIRM|nr:FtsH/Yme1/Tma family ATP-dependent metallopeptidase [Keratinibaculum paraultunense]QQY78794.1 ATP-dependent metallopeptidase FtsH/Yme1/Tma family protein [Keratinibaculum paraultunense]TCS87497.1 cell division protease FtsH [Keratinibaculum paraultunense]
MKITGRTKLIIIIFVFISLFSTVYFYISENSKYIEMSYKTFLNHVEEGLIEEIKLSNKSKFIGKFKNGNEFIIDNPRKEGFKEYLLLHDVKVIEEEISVLSQGIGILGSILGIGFLAYVVSKNGSKQIEKEMAYMLEMNTENNLSEIVTFDDVAGNEEAKESLRELVDFIKNPGKYTKYGARLPRGILLYGPPGTGKTLLAKAVAGEAKVPFYAVSGSDFIQVYAGLGASRIRELFKKAKEHGKSVIFIDEIDALGKKRKGTSSHGGSEEGDRTLNALLTEMSGFKENEGIIVMAATNRLDTLDEALLRPGRFDRQIEVGLPDVNARFAILKLHSRNKPLSKDVDLQKVALETIYFSGAKLENLMNESAMIAAKRRDKYITKEHINKAYYNILVGEEKKDRSSISLADKKITAFHEAGHALVAKKVSTTNRVTKVSIIPSTKGMGGFSLNLPPDRMYRTKKDIITNIKIALGGRAAEELIFGKENITTGAASDLQKATEMTISMIGSYGMDDEMGLVNYDVVLNSNLNMDVSLMERTKEILDNLYEETKRVLEENIYYLEKIANELLEKESLEEEEIEKILAS